MAIEKYFDELKGPEAVFNPIPSFAGEWFISYDNLTKNAKIENGKNLFLEFMKKNYDEPLFKLFKTDFYKFFPLEFVSIANENRHGRCFCFYAFTFYAGVFTFLNLAIDKVKETEKEHEDYLTKIFEKGYEGFDSLNLGISNALKEKGRRLNDVKINEINSEYFDAALEDYAVYKNDTSFSGYIEAMYDITTKLSEGFLNLGDFFGRDLSFQEIYEAFEPDKFYLLFAVALYDNLLIMEKENRIVKNSVGYLDEYFKICNKISGEEKNYNPKVLYEMENGKKIRYSRRELQKDYEEFMRRHSEIKPLHLPPLKEEDKDKYLDIDLVEKLAKLTEDDTKINWELLPKGEGDKKEKNNEPKQIVTPTKTVDIDDVTKRIDFLENTGYVGKLKGLNTFTGYYGYVYPNGTVILEKFWEDEEGIRPAINYATYIMNIDNFITMSKISRINLVEYIKTLPEIGVKRLYHSSIANWKRNIYKEINGAYRLEDAIEFINNLKSRGDSREQ